MSEQPIFYNTTNLVNSELLAAIESATKQNERVMLIFRTKNRPMSPSEVHAIYQTWFERCPLWSIRARMSTLSRSVYINKWTEIVCIYEAELFKTDLPLRPGAYKRGERVWQLKPTNMEPDKDIKMAGFCYLGIGAVLIIAAAFIFLF